VAAEAVLRSGKVNYWTGEEARQFEHEFAQACQVGHAVAVANGTVALEAALHALNIGPGDEVVVTPRSFIASASCVAMRGATPVFADVDPISQNITAATIHNVLSERTRAVICVHLAGWPCDMDPIMALARQYGFDVIEDCAQAHGALYKGRPVGSLGDIAAFSFCQDKIMTTGGEGGMVVTNEPDLWQQVWSWKDHGKSFAATRRQHPPGFRWLHASFGTNGRLTEMQAAIGRAQLRKLPEWSAVRQRNATILDQALAEAPCLRLVSPPPEITHAYYKYYAFLHLDRLRADWTRDRIVSEINAAGVPAFAGSCPEIYDEQAFARTGLRPANRLPHASELGRTSLMLLVDPTFDADAMCGTAVVVREVLERAMA
jgi:dTDP-4-amino-4,6-dideoxygalactose transaminase